MNTNHFKQKIEEELQTVTEELSTVGRRNPDNPKDWEATPEEGEVDTADPNVVADKFEEFEANTAILKQLEIRFNELKEALSQIENGTYGVCKICAKEIEPERLNANPAATTCIEHKDE